MVAAKLVYIVVLNWNGYKDTIDCVRSCKKITYPHFKILIVENGSTDGSEAFLREEFPDVELIQTGRNMGYAGGNNRGVEHALSHEAEYVWLLNNDTIVAPEALTELVAVFEEQPDAGIVGSKIYYHDEPDTVWFAGGYIEYHKGSSGHIGQYVKDEGQYEEVREVDYITGCSLMISRRAVQSVGLMDERFFLLYEETDWNEMVKKHDFKVLLAPKSHVWHKISKSLGEYSPLYNYYLFRNCLLFTLKHRPSLLFMVCLQKLKEVRLIYKRGDKDTALSSLRGMADFFLRRFGARSA